MNTRKALNIAAIVCQVVGAGIGIVATRIGSMQTKLDLKDEVAKEVAEQVSKMFNSKRA